MFSISIALKWIAQLPDLALNILNPYFAFRKRLDKLRRGRWLRDKWHDFLLPCSLLVYCFYKVFFENANLMVINVGRAKPLYVEHRIHKQFSGSIDPPRLVGGKHRGATRCAHCKTRWLALEFMNHLHPALKKSTILGTLFLTLLLTEMRAMAIPCASDYSTYRRKLLAEKWTPVAVKNSYPPFNEVSSGNRIGTAKWLNPQRNEVYLFILWARGDYYCVSPNFSTDSHWTEFFRRHRYSRIMPKILWTMCLYSLSLSLIIFRPLTTFYLVWRSPARFNFKIHWANGITTIPSSTKRMPIGLLCVVLSQ